MSDTNGSSPMRDQILDAAEFCFEHFGIQKTTLIDVAKKAGVSRVSVYRQFAGRDELFLAAGMRIINRRWQDIADQLSEIKDLNTWLLEALLTNWRMMQQESMHQRYHQSGAVDEGMHIMLSEEGRYSLSKHFVGLMKKTDQKSTEHIDDIAEWLHWMSYIMAAQKSQRITTEDDWRRWLSKQISGGIIQPK